MSLALALQGEQLHDQAFEHAAQLIDVDGVGQGDDRHARALGVGEFHQAFGLQVTQASRTEVRLTPRRSHRSRSTRRSPGSSWKFMIAAQFVQHDFAQGNGVAIDLEAVVEWLAFHQVRSL
jgi:hypothetical protein